MFSKTSKLKKLESIELTDEKELFLYVPPKHAHLVISKANNSVLLVLTDYPELASDQIDYKINM